MKEKDETKPISSRPFNFADLIWIDWDYLKWPAICVFFFFQCAGYLVGLNCTAGYFIVLFIATNLDKMSISFYQIISADSITMLQVNWFAFRIKIGRQQTARRHFQPGLHWCTAAIAHMHLRFGKGCPRHVCWIWRVSNYMFSPVGLRKHYPVTRWGPFSFPTAYNRATKISLKSRFCLGKVYRETSLSQRKLFCFFWSYRNYDDQENGSILKQTSSWSSVRVHTFAYSSLCQFLSDIFQLLPVLLTISKFCFWLNLVNFMLSNKDL